MPPPQHDDIENVSSTSDHDALGAAIRDVGNLAKKNGVFHEPLDAEPADDRAHDNEHHEIMPGIDKGE